MQSTACRNHAKSHARLLIGAIGTKEKEDLLDLGPSIGLLKLTWQDGPDLHIEVPESAIIQRYGPFGNDLPRIVVSSPK